MYNKTSCTLPNNNKLNEFLTLEVIEWMIDSIAMPF